VWDIEMMIKLNLLQMRTKETEFLFAKRYKKLYVGMKKFC